MLFRTVHRDKKNHIIDGMAYKGLVYNIAYESTPTIGKKILDQIMLAKNSE